MDQFAPEPESMEKAMKIATRESTLTHADRHANAAAYVRIALTQLDRAIRAEDGLEWDERLRELRTEAESIHGGLTRYANNEPRGGDAAGQLSKGPPNVDPPD